MTARGKTTPASTGGSFRPHSGTKSRVTVDGPFVFNSNEHDTDQVAPYFDDYADAVQQAAADDPAFRRYQDQMRGRIPAIAGPDEDAALRLLGKAWNADWTHRGVALAEANYDAYKAVYDEMIAAGDYPYNDSFRGLIPGIAHETDKNPGVVGTMQDHAIYLMQQMRSRKEMQAQVDAFIAEGAKPIDTVTGPEQFAKLMHHRDVVGGAAITVYENVRLHPPTNGGNLLAVIPKGHRNPIDYIAVPPDGHRDDSYGNLIGLR